MALCCPSATASRIYSVALLISSFSITAVASFNIFSAFLAVMSAALGTLRSLIFVWQMRSISRILYASLPTTNVNDLPVLPARPVLPMRCT